MQINDSGPCTLAAKVADVHSSMEAIGAVMEDWSSSAVVVKAGRRVAAVPSSLASQLL